MPPEDEPIITDATTSLHYVQPSPADTLLHAEQQGLADASGPYSADVVVATRPELFRWRVKAWTLGKIHGSAIGEQAEIELNRSTAGALAGQRTSLERREEELREEADGLRAEQAEHRAVLTDRSSPYRDLRLEHGPGWSRLLIAMIIVFSLGDALLTYEGFKLTGLDEAGLWAATIAFAVSAVVIGLTLGYTWREAFAGDRRSGFILLGLAVLVMACAGLLALSINEIRASAFLEGLIGTSQTASVHVGTIPTAAGPTDTQLAQANWVKFAFMAMQLLLFAGIVFAEYQLHNPVRARYAAVSAKLRGVESEFGRTSVAIDGLTARIDALDRNLPLIPHLWTAHRSQLDSLGEEACVVYERALVTGLASEEATVAMEVRAAARDVGDDEIAGAQAGYAAVADGRDSAATQTSDAA
ncbi:MAG TPA: hypothetical protein VFC82_02585 [Actinomycetaceae bacterium]|nr:hypothetical protein [Actinomycetaceae bacterium]